MEYASYVGPEALSLADEVEFGFMTFNTSAQRAERAVRSYYEAFNEKNWDAMLELVSENVAHDVNQGEREIGRQAFARFLQHMAQRYDERLDDFIVFVSPDGARAAAEFTCTGRYLVTAPGFPDARGQRYRLAVGAFFAVAADGALTRISNHYNVSEWVRQIS